jgi:hypothetical protein
MSSAPAPYSLTIGTPCFGGQVLDVLSDRPGRGFKVRSTLDYGFFLLI